MDWKICIVELTRYCPFRCPNCYMRQRGDLNNPVDGIFHMSSVEYRRMLENFAAQGGTGVEILGGEPTYHPEFLKLVEFSLQLGLETWIYTNLHRVGRNPDLANTLMAMRQAHNQRLYVVGKSSVPDFTSPEQRQVQAYTLGTDDVGVEMLSRGREAMVAAGWRRPFFGVENLLNATNIGWAPVIYEYGLATGYFFVDCEWPTYPGRGASIAEYFRLLPSEEQLAEFIVEIQKIDARYGLPVVPPVPPHLTGKNEQGVPQGCVAFKRGGLYVAVNGAMRLCSSGLPLVNESGRQLNIFKDLIEKILNNPVVVARRKSCKQSQITSGPCRTCTDFNRCLAGCAAFKEAFYGTPLVSYPMCPQQPWAEETRRWKKFASTFLPPGRF